MLFARPFHRLPTGIVTTILAVNCCLTAVAWAGKVELKNGMILEGQPVKIQSLHRSPVGKPGPTTIYHVVLVNNGWRRTFVPIWQVPNDGLNLDVSLTRRDEFTVPQLKQGRSLVVQNVGSILAATPFDLQFGRRTVTIATAQKPLQITQGISLIAPDHVNIVSHNYVWDYGIGLTAVPQDVIISVLQNPLVCKPNEAQDRLARARFYVAAEWYLPAFAELESIARDFPDREESVETFRQELMQIFGRHILSEIRQRRQAGQLQLADDSLSKLPLPLLAGSVQQEILELQAISHKEVEDLDRITIALGDLQAKLTDETARAGMTRVRPQMLREFDRVGLDRLQPFLQAQSDPRVTPSESLALAVTGWMLGAENANTDLNRALRIWDARGLIREFLRSNDPVVRNQLFDELRVLESVGPDVVQQMLKKLPPVLDAETIVPGETSLITLPKYLTDDPERTYHVIVPPEYSPNKLYPCLLALRPEHKSTEETAVWWAGTVDQPAWAQRRGYIVIAPDYVPESTRQYPYSTPANQTVMDCLRDARLRFGIDPDRTYLVGHDMGADAAFDLGLAHPDEFAGVVPIGGVSDLYGRFYSDNGELTSWYIVRGELGRDSTSEPFAKYLDRWFVKGAKYDMVYVEFPGRGLDPYADELPRLFGWFELHVRRPLPLEFEYLSLRQVDNSPFWVTAELPRTFVLPQPGGNTRGVKSMKITGKITPGNSVYVSSPATQVRLRLYDGLINLNERVDVHINGKAKPPQFLETDLRAMLDDFRQYADRSRIATVIVDY
ncbi:hypothetical protein GC163_12070 [bacterium]|nr:hypothetical protein [bacterium]